MNPRIALLIDADNVSADEIDFAVKDASSRGDLLVRKAFGRLASIKAREAVLTRYNCTAEVAFEKEKNAADIYLAMTAEQLASRGKFEEIAILSHDRDFSSVATNIGRYGIRAVAYRRETVKTKNDKALFAQVFLPDHTEYKRDLNGFRTFVERQLKKAAKRDTSLSNLRAATQKVFGKGLPAELGAKDFPTLLSKAGFKRETTSGGVRDGRVRRK